MHITTIAFLLFAVNLFSFQKAPPLSPADFEVAGLNEKMTSAEVKKVLGKPQSVLKEDSPSDPDRKFITLKYRSLIIDLRSEDVVIGVSITSPAYPTKRGLRVGDSGSRVIQLYGKPNGKYRSDWDYEDPNDSYHVLRVSFRKNKVELIFLGELVD